MIAAPPRRGAATAQQTPAIVLASRLELRRVRDVPAFLIASAGLWWTFPRAPGGVRLRLAVSPLTRTFWTWSSWATPSGPREYVTLAEHQQVMRTFAPRLAGSTFTTVPGGTAPRAWKDVEALLSPGDQADRHPFGRT